MNYNLNDAQRLWLREVERRTTNGEMSMIRSRGRFNYAA